MAIPILGVSDLIDGLNLQSTSGVKSMSAGLSKALIATNVALLCVVVGAAAGSWLDLGSRIGEWRRSRAQASLIQEVWPDLVVGGDRIGNDTTQILVQFSDYECPYCRRAYPVLDSLIAEGAIGVLIHRQLPLSIHSAAAGAARASICAGKQGRFAEMHRQLLSSPTWIQDTDWVREATVSGVGDISQFQQCVASAMAQSRLDTDLMLSRRIGAVATPTYVTRSGFHSGVLDRAGVMKLLGLTY